MTVLTMCTPSPPMGRCSITESMFGSGAARGSNARASSSMRAVRRSPSATKVTLISRSSSLSPLRPCGRVPGHHRFAGPDGPTCTNPGTSAVLLKFSTKKAVATVNFSVPDDVAFNEVSRVATRAPSSRISCVRRSSGSGAGSGAARPSDGSWNAGAAVRSCPTRRSERHGSTDDGDPRRRCERGAQVVPRRPVRRGGGPECGRNPPRRGAGRVQMVQPPHFLAEVAAVLARELPATAGKTWSIFNRWGGAWPSGRGSHGNRSLRTAATSRLRYAVPRDRTARARRCTADEAYYGKAHARAASSGSVTSSRPRERRWRRRHGFLGARASRERWGLPQR